MSVKLVSNVYVCTCMRVYECEVGIKCVCMYMYACV
jgi:hypothetical protein